MSVRIHPRTATAGAAIPGSNEVVIVISAAVEFLAHVPVAAVSSHVSSSFIQLTWCGRVDAVILFGLQRLLRLKHSLLFEEVLVLRFGLLQSSSGGEGSESDESHLKNFKLL